MTASSSTADSIAPAVAPGNGPLLSVRDLRVSFGRGDRARQVLNGVSFSVDPGETVALVGESGSGKSVTAMSIMRLLRMPDLRTSGSATFAGTDLLGLSEAQMRKIRGDRIAMIFQEPMTSLNPVLTVGAQIAETLQWHRGISRSAALEEARRLLERVRIPAAASRVQDYPHQFSGGMRQRVMIAMALACNPALLIADEPTTALDVTIQAQILDIIREIKSETGMSVLFITHDMGVVAEVSDRTVVMYRGDIVEQGATAQIFAAPERPYTRALLSAVPELGAMRDLAVPERFSIVDKTTGTVTPARPLTPPSDNASGPALEVKGLTTRFDIRGAMGVVVGRVHAVENVSFVVERGETLALVGESGCGKSTLGRSILGVAEPLSGEIIVNGHSVGIRGSRRRPAASHGMQMIFQDPYGSLNPRVRVGDAIAEPVLNQGRLNRAQARQRAVDLLLQVGLDADMADRLPHEFSGGQRQRVCIARALATNPSLIVADEAVSALDVSVKAQIANLMLDLQEEHGLSYLFISHDMAVVERLSHKVAVMHLGEIVEIGPRQAVFNNPRHPYTQRLLSAVPVADPARRRAHGSQQDAEIRSPVRGRNYVPPVRQYLAMGEGHFVQQWDEDWERRG